MELSLLFIFFGLFAIFTGSLDFLVKDDLVKRMFGIFLCVSYGFIWASRPVWVGADTVAYFSYYNDACGFKCDLSNTFEWGFNFLMRASSSIGLSFFIFQFICLSLVSVLFYISYRLLVPNYLFATSITMLSPFFASITTNILRQGLASGFVALATALFIKRKYLLGVASFVTAVTMHLTAIPFIFFLLFAFSIPRSRLAIVLSANVVFLMLFFFAINLNILVEVFQFLGIDGKPLRRLMLYLNDNNPSAIGFSVMVDFALLFFVFMLMLREKVLVHRFQKGKLYILFSISLLGLIYYLLFSSYGVLSRFSIYSYFSTVAILALFLARFNFRFKPMVFVCLLSLTWIRLGFEFFAKGYFTL